jgi:hypothetical protein
MSSRRRPRGLSAALLLASGLLGLQACGGPKTCQDIVEKRFREIDRDLSRNKDLSEDDIVSGIDDSKIVDALWDTIDDVLPGYESGKSYSQALELAAKRQCSRRGL